MWVQLRSVQRIEVQGKLVTYRPGDWVDVGRQTAMLWVSRGDAVLPVASAPKITNGRAGVVLLGDSNVVLQDYEISRSTDPGLPFDLTLIWDGITMLRPEMLNSGFSFLSTWEVACPLYSYSILATHLGTENDRERTKLLIRDLRVPVYESGLMFVRRCESTELLIKTWLKEREGSTDDRLAFMRAFYRVKPLMLALPITWVGGKVD